MTKHLIAVAIAAIALQGCQIRPVQTTATAEDMDGIAKSCTASPVEFNGGTANATISLSNDGWCALRTTESDGRPFQLALVKTRPEHGRVLVQPINGKTRIEYTADPRYVGSDRFTVALRSRTANTPDSTLQVTVTVSQGEGGTPVVTPASTAAPSSRTTPPRTAPARRR